MCCSVGRKSDFPSSQGQHTSSEAEAYNEVKNSSCPQQTGGSEPHALAETRSFLLDGCRCWMWTYFIRRFGLQMPSIVTDASTVTLLTTEHSVTAHDDHRDVTQWFVRSAIETLLLRHFLDLTVKLRWTRLCFHPLAT